jgi:hypothetical protein
VLIKILVTAVDQICSSPYLTGAHVEVFQLDAGTFRTYPTLCSTRSIAFFPACTRGVDCKLCLALPAVLFVHLIERLHAASLMDGEPSVLDTAALPQHFLLSTKWKLPYALM